MPIINLRFEANNQELPYASPSQSFLSTVLPHILRISLAIAGLLVFGYLIWGAFDWILSAGDSSKVEKARNKMTQAILGLLVLSATVGIFLAIQNILDVCILNFGGVVAACA